MIFPSNRVRIVIATKPVDFRKGHDGLAALVNNELRKEPFTGTVFVFRDELLYAIGSRTMANAGGSAKALVLGSYRAGDDLQTAGGNDIHMACDPGWSDIAQSCPV